MKTLVTDRLIIRRITTAQDDARFLLGLLNEPSWLRYIGDRHVRTESDAVAYIENGPLKMYATHGYGFCIVALKETGERMGLCGLAKRDYLDSPDIGFAFMPKYRGCGYAFESAGAQLHYARTELAMTRVLATTRIDNSASQALLEKLGLTFVRLIRHPDGDRDLKLFATRDY